MIQKNIPILELNRLLKNSIFTPNSDILSEFFYSYHKKQRDRLSLVEDLRRNYIQIPNLKYSIDIKTGSLTRDMIVIPSKDLSFKPSNFNLIITSGMVICRVIADFGSIRPGFIQNIEIGNTKIPSFRFCWYPDDTSKNAFKFTTMKNGVEFHDSDDDSYFALTTGLRIHGVVDESLLENFF